MTIAITATAMNSSNRRRATLVVPRAARPLHPLEAVASPDLEGLHRRPVGDDGNFRQFLARAQTPREFPTEFAALSDINRIAAESSG